MSKNLIVVGISLFALFSSNILAEDAIPADRLVTAENTYNSGSCGTSDIMGPWCNGYRMLAADETRDLEADSASKGCAEKGFPNYEVVSSVLSFETTFLSLGTDVVGRRKSTIHCLTAAEAKAIRDEAARLQAEKEKAWQDQLQAEAQARLNRALRVAIAKRTETGCEFNFELAASEESFYDSLDAIQSPAIEKSSQPEFYNIIKKCSDTASLARRSIRISPVQRLTLASFNANKEYRASATYALFGIVSGDTSIEVLNTIVAVQNPASVEAQSLLALPGANLLLERVASDDDNAGKAIRNALANLAVKTAAGRTCAAEAQAAVTALEKIVVPAGAEEENKSDIQQAISDLRYQYSQYLATPCQ